MDYVILNVGRMVTICESTNIDRLKGLYLSGWRLVGEAKSLEHARSVWEEYRTRSLGR